MPLTPKNIMPEATPPPVSVADFGAIIASFSEEKTLYFSPGGKLIYPPEGAKDDFPKFDQAGVMAVKIKPLSDEQMSEADEMVEAIVPPVKKQPGFGGVEKLEIDPMDPEYQKKTREARRKRRAFIVITGLVEPKINGATIEEKAKFLRTKLPARFVDLLLAQIEDISGGTLHALGLANFTSAAGSNQRQESAASSTSASGNPPVTDANPSNANAKAE